MMGNSNAMVNVGKLYEYGLGVRKNTDYARTCFEQAAQLGNQEAKKILANLPAQ